MTPSYRRAFVFMIVLVALSGCGGAPQGTPRAPISSAARLPDSRERLFAPDSVWNKAEPNDAPIDPASPELIRGLVSEFVREQEAGTGPYIETDEGSSPLYVVGASQPTQSVRLETQAPYVQTLQRAFERVPIPSDAHPARGTDAHMTIWQPSSDRLWEFWRAHRDGTQWRASYGGAIGRLSESPGYFRPDSWPGARAVWGATASSLPLAGGLIRIGELERNVIPHALSVALPAPRAGVFSWPAQRTDGTDPSAGAIPEGARLRLDPTFDVSSLRAAPIVKAMALAAQRYGILVRDRTGAAIGFYAEDPSQFPTNPYPKLFDNKSPTQLLAQFPWSHLRVIRMDLRRGS